MRIPLFAHRVRHAERFLKMYPNPEELTRTADKIRYYRHKKGVLITDLASYASLDRKTMSHYECKNRKHYSISSLERIAEYLEIPVTALLDDYTRFIYQGQGKQLKEYRKSHSLRQIDLARQLQVSKTSIQRWESEKKRISKDTFDKMSQLF